MRDVWVLDMEEDPENDNETSREGVALVAETVTLSDEDEDEVCVIEAVQENDCSLVAENRDQLDECDIVGSLEKDREGVLIVDEAEGEPDLVLVRRNLVGVDVAEYEPEDDTDLVSLC